MPDLNGMDFIKTLTAPPLVVFTTAYAEYAVEGFKVNAVDYLLKPFGLQDFMRAANRIQERLTPHAPSAPQSTNTGSSEDDTIFLKTDYRIVKVSISDIRYIEAMSEYLKVWLEGEPKPIITLLSMKKMEEVNKNRVIMDTDTYLPIGEMYKDTFLSYLNTKFLGK